MMKLKQIVNQLYNDSHIKPTIVGPGGFYDQKWFATLLQFSGSGVVNAVTQHLYNLGPDSWKQWVRRRRKRLNERKSQRSCVMRSKANA
ncbi:putative glycosidase [Rosa chinensis]|uniref:Putative glycosidase n=2 Tax=Rosa chinensis TaxID=74649 RepID=A0A2P6PQU5_ROSCH|nr:putative glycosidase [Rosa chinensis]